MNETGSRIAGGMTSRHPNQTRQAVMDRLRHRIGQYRKRHSDCQNKYAQSLPAVQDMERQEAMNLHKRALDSRSRIMNVNGKAAKQNDGEGKLEPQQQLANGYDKSTNAILHIREQILLKKRKHEQNMNSALNSFTPSNDENSNLGGECLSKFQRQEGVLLQASEGSNGVASVNQARQVDHTSAQLNPTHFGARDNKYIHDGSMSAPRMSNTIGSETYANGAQQLSSSPFAPPDFKQEKPVIVSCEEPTHPNGGTGTLVNGLNQASAPCAKLNLPAGQEYIRQELDYFDHVIQARFNEDGAPAQTIQHQTSASVPSCDDDRGQVPENQLGGHHPKSHQLKEFARKSQLAQAQQVVPYSDNQDHANHQFPHQHASQYALGSAGHQSPSIQHRFAAGKYHGSMPLMSSEQQQLLQEPNHPVASVAGGFTRHFESPHQQRGSAPQSRQQQQQQSFYDFPQNSLPSSKLSHMPSQAQHLYSQRFQNQSVLPTSQGAGLVRPIGSHTLSRYSMPRSQPHYQRQTSMPPLQGQTFLNSDSQYQQQVAGFQGDQSGFSNPVTELTATYHYQRRNSFPIYRNSNQQPENLHYGMQQNLGSSQASLLRGVLQNPSQSIPTDRDFVVGPNMGMPSSTAMQTGPLLSGRPLSANPDLNPGVPRSQHSSILFRGSVSQQSSSVLQQGAKFQAASNARKVPPESSYSVLNPTSAVHREMNERQTSVTVNDAHFNAYSPLNALDKAPSFTSLLEQSAINQGNLETTYTGSIPNLDLLGEILGQ